MASCSNNETTDWNSSDPTLIQFSPYAGAITKASQTYLDDIKSDANGYGVHAYDSSGTNIIDNIKIIHNGTNFESVIPQYWDESTDYTFHAYYPYSDEAIVDSTVSYSAIAQSATSHSDILSGDVVSVVKEEVSSYPTVTHILSHALVNVDFAIGVESGKSMELEISSFKIQGVLMEHNGLHLVDGFTADGEITLSADNLYTYGLDSDFDSSIMIDDSSAYNFANFSEIVEIHNGVDSAGTFMILPQTLTAWGTDEDYTEGARIVIEYKLKIGGKYIVGGEDDYVAAAFPIPTCTWEAGQQYAYTLTFERTGNGGQNPGGDDGKTPGGGNTGNDTPSGGTDPGDPIIPTGSEIQFDITVSSWDDASDSSM